MKNIIQFFRWLFRIKPKEKTVRINYVQRDPNLPSLIRTKAAQKRYFRKQQLSGKIIDGFRVGELIYKTPEKLQYNITEL